VSYELSAEIESADRVMSIRMGSMAEAQRFVDEMQRHGLWPEGAEAVIQHLPTGAMWLHGDEWEPYTIRLQAEDGHAALFALETLLKVEGDRWGVDLRDRVRDVIARLKAWLESREMPNGPSS